MSGHLIMTELPSKRHFLPFIFIVKSFKKPLLIRSLTLEGNMNRERRLLKEILFLGVLTKKINSKALTSAIIALHRDRCFGYIAVHHITSMISR